MRAAKFMMREQSNQLTWLHKPLNEVTTSDIEHYTRERLDEVAPATVDREIDILRSIFNVAVTVWDYNLVKNPMSAVRRPKYFNERDRRLVDGEEARLLAALSSLDLARATEPVLRDMANETLEGRHFTSASDRKRQLAAVRAQLLAAAEAQADVIPYLQAFFLFQLMTGARRSETCSPAPFKLPRSGVRGAPSDARADARPGWCPWFEQSASAVRTPHLPPL